MPTDPSDHRYDLPTASIFDGVGEYIPLLLASVDAELGRDDVWNDDEVEEAHGYVEDIRAWLQELEGFMIPVGGILLWYSATIPANFLKCDGTLYNKADYPALYAVLAGTVGETALQFEIPNFNLRLPIGVGTDGIFAMELGEPAGSYNAEITTGNMPEHAHTVPEHTHTTQAHTHLQNSHNHTQNSHNHTLTDPGHQHNVPVRDNVNAFGALVIAAGANANSNSVRQSANADTGITIAAQTATNNAATAVNQNSTVIVNAAAEHSTGNSGSGTPFSILNPVRAVFYIIRAE